MGHLPVVRCLPNIASCVQAGITAYTRGKFCNETDTKPFLTLFSMCGHCEEVQEKYLDAFTAFSGSGVAFVSQYFYKWGRKGGPLPFLYLAPPF